MIKELHDKLLKKKITSVQLTEEYFDKIEKDFKKLNTKFVAVPLLVQSNYLYLLCL